MRPPAPDAKFKVGDKVWAVSDHDRVGEVVKVSAERIKVRLPVSSVLGSWGAEEYWDREDFWIGVEEMTALTLMGDEDETR